MTVSEKQTNVPVVRDHCSGMNSVWGLYSQHQNIFLTSVFCQETSEILKRYCKKNKKFCLSNKKKCVKLLEISSIHDGHDQTKFLLCLEGVRQWHNEATVNLLKNPLLHRRSLQEDIRKFLFFFTTMVYWQFKTKKVKLKTFLLWSWRQTCQLKKRLKYI